MSDALSVIAESALLSAEDSERILALRDELAQTWETAQVFRTRTEMRVSVLDDIKRPTPDAKYWQAVREQDVHVAELVELSYEYRKAQIRLAMTERDREAATDALARAMLGIEAEQQRWRLRLMERTAHHRAREIGEWSAIKAELRPQLAYGTEDVDAHQLEAMRRRFQAEARLITAQTPVADARNILSLASTAQRIAGGGR